MPPSENLLKFMLERRMPTPYSETKEVLHTHNAGALFQEFLKRMDERAGTTIPRHIERMPELQLQSTLTCPHCGHQATETMPTDACVAVYDCKGCGAALRPLPGSCCVFCSYGSVPCPPIQQGVEPCCTPLPVARF